VDDELRGCLDELAGDPSAGRLWRPIAEALGAALDGGEDGALARAALATARSIALSGRAGLPLLLDQLLLGLDRLRVCGAGEGETFVACQTVLLRSVAEGYAEGLEETVGELRRRAEELLTVDPSSGVLRQRQTGEHLALELLRCQRMDLPLGVAALQPAEDGSVSGRRRTSRRRDVVGKLLRDNVRRYDGVGMLEDGGHVLFLPGVSRDGLLSAAERLHRQIAEDPRTAAYARSTFALLHLDCADLSSAEILAAVGGRRTADADYLVWV
jgi:hypothetical protein